MNARTPTPGEVLKLGPPASGEVVITVDPAVAGTAFAAGTYALLPKAEIPPHRLLERDELLVICKGQGRATLREQSIIVVPGSILFVPRGAWQGLRNTGTGALQFVWVASPPGLELFFRDLSRLGASPSLEALQEVTQRHGIELRAPGAPGAPAAVVAGASGQRRRHRGGRRHHNRQGTAAPTAMSSPAGPSSAPEPAASVPPTAASPAIRSAAPSVAPRRHRGRRGGRGRRRAGGGAVLGSSAASAPPASRQAAGGASAASSPPSASGSARPGGARPRSSRSRPHWRRGKEVYMGGKWVRVEGEGPMIAPGSGRPARRASKPDEDDDPPSIRLSVPL